jgi:hypothetical protein
MKCPHCLTAFHDNPHNIVIGVDVEDGWVLTRQHCPSCKKFVLALVNGYPIYQPGTAVFTGVGQIKKVVQVWPKGTSRPPCPAEVPKQFADDYIEACLVLSDSAKAAAALARRCLQNVLREAAKVRAGNLADEIQQAIDSGKLPFQLAESIDAVRNIGNFAAHPMKSQQTGEILEVEPGEAEWNLDVLEVLFDFYFVQPAMIQKKRAALNQKLQAAGKPPMK